LIHFYKRALPGRMMLCEISVMDWVGVGSGGKGDNYYYSRIDK